MSEWRARARSWSLLFCAAVGAFLVNAIVVSRLAVWVGNAARGVESVFLRLVLGFVALDLAKLIGLAPAAWLLGPGLALHPTAAAAGLVLLTFGFEAAVAFILQQDPWLLREPAVLAGRAAAAALLVWILALLIRRRRSRGGR